MDAGASALGAVAPLPRRVDTSSLAAALPRAVRPEGAGSSEGLEAGLPRLPRPKGCSDSAAAAGCCSAARLLPRPRPPLTGASSAASAAGATAAAPRLPRPAGLAGSASSASSVGRLAPRLAAGLQPGEGSLGRAAMARVPAALQEQKGLGNSLQKATQQGQSSSLGGLGGGCGFCRLLGGALHTEPVALGHALEGRVAAGQVAGVVAAVAQQQDVALICAARRGRGGERAGPGTG